MGPLPRLTPCRTHVAPLSGPLSSFSRLVQTRPLVSPFDCSSVTSSSDSHWLYARYRRCDGRIRDGEQPPTKLAAPYFTPNLTSSEPVNWDTEPLTLPLLAV